jgi:uncharacterized membrane protein YfcA
MEEIILYGLAFFVISFLYATVGHGGASGYLALMAIFNFNVGVIKPTALILNLLVSFIAFVSFYKAKHFKSSMLWPLVITSIPFAYLGSITPVSDGLYKKLLAVVLLIVVARILFLNKLNNSRPAPKWYWLSLTGAIIGVVSGMIGMGGGILLSPLLLLMGWSTQQQTAALSAIFIFLNSAAGMLGQFKKGFELDQSTYAIIIFVLLGGWLGAYFGSKKLQSNQLKFILASVLIVAATKLLFVK